MPVLRNQRPCKDCKVMIDFIPRRVRCLSCYKKNLNKPVANALSLFIEDDDKEDWTRPYDTDTNV